MKNIFTTIALALIAFLVPAMASASAPDKEEAIDAQSIVFDHLGDGYGWEVPFNHHERIPLPVIVWGSDGLHVFSSSRVTHGDVYRDGNVEFKIAGKDSPYKGKIVEIVNGEEVIPRLTSPSPRMCVECSSQCSCAFGVCSR